MLIIKEINLKVVTIENLIIIHLRFKTTRTKARKKPYLLNPLQKWLKPVLITLTMTV